VNCKNAFTEVFVGKELGYALISKHQVNDILRLT